MQGKCRLCGKNADLQESHIIPSFVYRWLKDSSGTGYLRFGPEPNKRVQDGYKNPKVQPEYPVIKSIDCRALLDTFRTDLY